MGALCTCGAKDAVLDEEAKKQSQDETKLPDFIDESCTLGALLQSLMPIALPIVRMVVAKTCVDEKMVLRDEKEVTEIDVTKEEEQLFKPLQFEFGQVSMVDADTLEKDVQACPEFQWPQVNAATPGQGFCLDLIGVTLKLTFAKGVELKFPVDGPFGIQADIEIGSGDEKSDVKEAFIQVTIPKLRVWYSNIEGSRKAYVAFMARPKVTPNLNVNVDRGKGDFMSMDFQEHDGLDDTIETVLCGFGPSSLTKKKEELEGGETEVKSSWVAEALGNRISAMMHKIAGIDGTDAPLEIDLEEPIAEAIRIALGKPRSVDLIEADIETLQAEKKKHETYVSANPEEKQGTKSRDLNGEDTAVIIPEAKKEDKIPENCSTGAFCRTLLPIVLPIVRQVLSKNLVGDDMVLRKEEKVTTINVQNEEELVVAPLELELGNTRVVQLTHYQKDVQSMPEFRWPKMTPDSFIWDIVNFRLKLVWAPDVEFAFPADGPIGMKAMLEIGKGAGRSDVKQAWVDVVIPKLRICYDNVKPQRKAYVLFLARPRVTPNLNVNVDRGKGDFMSMDFQEHDGLDDAIETVLCGFGPSSVTKRKLSKEEKKKHEKSSWIAEAIGKRVSASLKTFGGVDGTDAPLEIDLEETLKLTIDSAMGIPRPIELIDADLEVVEEELKVAKEYYANKSPEKEGQGSNSNGAGDEVPSANASRNVPIQDLPNKVDNEEVGNSSTLTACCGILSIGGDS